jgi:hypothetical protein
VKSKEPTHLYRVIINRVNTVDTQPNANKHDDGASAPPRELAVWRRAGWWLGGCVYIGLKDLAVDGDGDAKRCFREVMDKGSENRSTTERIIRALSTHLIAPAAVLGPNHCPTSLPSSFPARAIRCTLNGQSGDGESKNHVKIWTYVE